MKILVVEDNVDSRETFEAILILEGHEVRSVSNGMEVFNAIKEFQPTLAFIDIELPDISGYEVARRLRERSVECPTYLVALTGRGAAEDRHASHRAGFDEHLVKPVTLESLLQAVQIAKNKADRKAGW